MLTTVSGVVTGDGAITRASAELRPPLTVVVPTRDRPEMLARTLERLAGDLSDTDEIVVVDSASRDAIPSDLVTRHGGILVRADVPGVSLARNLGWRAARHDVVAFVDDDIHVDPGWADAMRTAIAEEGVAFVTGRVEVPDDQTTEHAASVFTDTERRRLDISAGGIFGGSGNVTVRRAALAQVGGFDERLGPPNWFASAEDLDFFDRLVEAGFVGVYEPRACVRHLQWRDDRENLGVHWGYGKGMGARLAAMMWRDRRHVRAVLPMMFRLEGLKTAAGDIRERRRRNWGPPIVWRLGALLGFTVGLVRLRRRPPVRLEP